MFCTHMVHNLAKITKFWDRRTDPGRFAKPYEDGIVSHHWHHHSAPTRMRIFGCQQ